jgi:hypothetical protein
MSGMKPVSRLSFKKSERTRLGPRGAVRVVTMLVAALVLMSFWAPCALAAPPPTVAQNVGGLLKSYAEEVYGGLVGASSLVFLWNRRYTELATFLFAAIVVAWMVFAPELISKAAEGIGHQIFG